MTDTLVSVPANLLRKVLDTAEDDNHRVETEFCCSAEDGRRYQNERDRIEELKGFLPSG